MKITKRVVDAAEVRDKDYFIWEEELKGFGALISVSGKKVFFIPCALMLTLAACASASDRSEQANSDIEGVPSLQIAIGKLEPSRACRKGVEQTSKTIAEGYVAKQMGLDVSGYTVFCRNEDVGILRVDFVPNASVDVDVPGGHGDFAILVDPEAETAKFGGYYQ